MRRGGPTEVCCARFAGQRGRRANGGSSCCASPCPTPCLPHPMCPRVCRPCRLPNRPGRVSVGGCYSCAAGDGRAQGMGQCAWPRCPACLATQGAPAPSPLVAPALPPLPPLARRPAGAGLGYAVGWSASATATAAAAALGVPPARPPPSSNSRQRGWGAPAGGQAGSGHPSGLNAGAGAAWGAPPAAWL